MNAASERPAPSGWAQTDEALSHFYLEGHAVCGSAAPHRVPYTAATTRPCAGCDRWVKAVDAGAADATLELGLVWQSTRGDHVKGRGANVEVSLRSVRPAQGLPQIGWRWQVKSAAPDGVEGRVELKGWSFNPLLSVGKLAAAEGVRASLAAAAALATTRPPVLPTAAPPGDG